MQCIDHGLLIEDAITTLVAGNDFTTRTQIAIFRSLEPLDEPSDIRRDTMTPARAGQEYRVRMIGKSGINTACPTDFTNPPHLGLPREFTERASVRSPEKGLRQATLRRTDVIRRAIKLNQLGNLLKICVFWLADSLIVAGEPREDRSILDDPGNCSTNIIKGSAIVKNPL